MDLPALLPKELFFYGQAQDEKELLEKLKTKPPDLITFFEAVCSDETWSRVDHPEFTQQIMTWITQQVQKDHLDIQFVYRIADAIHDHYENLANLIPLDLTIQFKKEEQKTNSLLFIASGEYLRHLYRTECLGSTAPKLKLDTEPNLFAHINTFILQGKHDELWRCEPNTLFQLLTLANKYELLEFAYLTEDVLKRYLDDNNVFQILEKAQQSAWTHLRTCCMEFINKSEAQYDIRLIPTIGSIFALQFVNFGVDALTSFDKIKHLVTRIIFVGEQTTDPAFTKIVNDCPRLNSIDISFTKRFPNDLPPKLTELILGGCSWLGHEELDKILQACPNLKNLDLVSNVQLNVNAWAILRKAPTLTHLNLARCHQIRDDDFRVILEATRNLVDLNIEECTNITDHGFLELTHSAPDLAQINLSKTNIGDGALAEMGAHRLISINLSRCEEITPKGIIDLVRRISALKVLNITGIDISPNDIKTIKQIRPNLILVR